VNSREKSKMKVNKNLERGKDRKQKVGGLQSMGSED
jgi:hypothetical protein